MMTGDNLNNLRDRWRATLASLGAEPEASQAAFADVVACYRQPWRRYHTLEHLNTMFEQLALIGGAAANSAAVALAVWMHDVVYDTHRADNEAASAAYARRVLASLGVDATTIAAVQGLVLATAGHDAQEGDELADAFLDADLSVLGASPERYDSYSRAIREEYAWVGEAEYRAGRGDVLRRLLGRPCLYRTVLCRASLETNARLNIARELALLGPAA